MAHRASNPNIIKRYKYGETYEPDESDESDNEPDESDESDNEPDESDESDNESDEPDESDNEPDESSESDESNEPDESSESDEPDEFDDISLSGIMFELAGDKLAAEIVKNDDEDSDDNDSDDNEEINYIPDGVSVAAAQEISLNSYLKRKLRAYKYLEHAGKDYYYDHPEKYFMRDLMRHLLKNSDHNNIEAIEYVSHHVYRIVDRSRIFQYDMCLTGANSGESSYYGNSKLKNLLSGQLSVLTGCIVYRESSPLNFMRSYNLARTEQFCGFFCASAFTCAKFIKLKNGRYLLKIDVDTESG